MTVLSVGSLCTGYGGLDLAVNTVFGQTRLAWVSDIEPGPCKVLETRHADVPNLGDLTTCDWASIEAVDVLTAGYPCQPFSHAGQRKGTDDARHLWPSVCNAIGVLRPRLVVLENVAGHLSLGGPAVVADLARLGFHARWVVVRASDVGACHRRARLFIAASDTRSAGRQQERRGARSQEGEVGSGSRGHVARRDGEAGRRDGIVVEQHQSSIRNVLIAGEGDAQPASHTDERRRGRREPVTVGCAQGGTAAAWTRQDVRADTDFDGCEVVEREQPGVGSRSDADRLRSFGVYADAIARHEHAIGRIAPAPTDEKRRLSPRFVEWMMMLPEGWVTDVPGLSRTAQLRLLGNGVVPPQAEYALRLLTMEAAA